MELEPHLPRENVTLQSFVSSVIFVQFFPTWLLLGETATFNYFPFDACSFLVRYLKKNIQHWVISVPLREKHLQSPQSSLHPGPSRSLCAGCLEMTLTARSFLRRDVRITSTASASATSSSLASCEHRGAYTASAPGCEWCEPRGLTQLHPEFPKGNFEESRNLWSQCS